MTDHLLTRTLVIKRPLEEVFEFFADASNLEKITPPELNFHILTPLPIVMQTGTLIDYQLRLYGFPMKWRTEITLWQPPEVFVDTQLRGPYQKWVHRHTFTEIEERQTQIDDEVRYLLPLEPLSLLASPLIRRQLDYIFDYRQKKVAELLG